jgi:hypothetical protein
LRKKRAFHDRSANADPKRPFPALTLPTDSILVEMGLQTALAGDTGGEAAMNKFLSVGDIRIHRIVELEGPFLPARDVFPTLSAELLDANRRWLAPKALSRDDRLIFCFQSYVVRTPNIRFWLTVASATTRCGRRDRNGI